MQIYRDVLKKAWQVLWHYSWLWAFGLFAALAGNGGEYGSLVSSVERVINQGTALGALKSALAADEVRPILHNIYAIFAQAPVLFVWVIFVITIVILLVIWVVTVAQASIIRAAGSINKNEPTNFMTAVASGVKYFWPIFFLNLFIKFIIYLLLISALLPYLIYFLATPGAMWGLDVVTVVSFLVFVPLTIILSFILKYAAMYIVLEKEPWWHALGKAINLFLRNWLVSLEMAVALMLINFFISMVLVFLTIPDALTLRNSLILGSQFSALIYARLTITFIIFVAVGAWYATFQYAAWTILFQKLQSGNVVAKLVRLADEVPAYLDNWFQAKKPVSKTAAVAKTTRNRTSK